MFLSSTYPRDEHDVAGRFLADLVAVLPLRVSLVVPDDPRARRAAPLEGVRRRLFPNHGLFYGDGAVGNLSGGRCGRLAASLTLGRMLAASLAETRRAPVIWSHWAVPAGVVGALCRRRTGCRHVLSLHSGDVWWLEQALWRRAIARFVARRCDAILAPTEQLARRFEALSGRRPEILGTGVPDMLALATDVGTATGTANAGTATGTGTAVGTVPGTAGTTGTTGTTGTAGTTGTTGTATARSPTPAPLRTPAPPRLGAMCRLAPGKGLRRLLRCWTPQTPLHLEIAGEGPLEAELRGLAAPLPGVRLVGAVSGPVKAAWLTGLDGFVAPHGATPWGQPEGLPVSILEALSAQLPVLAYRGTSPGGPLRHEHNALLAPDDDPRALLEQAGRLARDAELRARLARAARRSSLPHLHAAVIPRWTALLGPLSAPGL